jgi:hypothetical protein
VNTQPPDGVGAGDVDRGNRAAEAEEIGTTRKFWIAGTMLWTLIITSLRATRLPNDFSKEHWFIDYRFGFVKRGLVGTIVTLATRAMHVRPTEQLVNILASVQFGLFCTVLMWLGLHLVRRSGWSNTVTLVVLVFLSSPFIVMSAHLIGYFDNIIIVLTVLSLGLLFRKRIWAASCLQAISILVHENALLVGLPVFCFGWMLVNSRQREVHEKPLSFAPLLVPVGAFVILTLSQRLSPPDLERSLTAYLSSYPFLVKRLGDVRVPHWVTITFYDSYLLHQGQFLGRVLSQSMLGVVLPSLLAVLGFVFDVYGVRALSVESMILLGACLAPQLMHLVAWDTSRIWTYSILCSFLLLWVYVELFPPRRSASQFIRLLCLVALALNIMGVTPLMDGLKDHFDIATRLLLYTPVMGMALAVTLQEESVPFRKRLSLRR